MSRCICFRLSPLPASFLCVCPPRAHPSICNSFEKLTATKLLSTEMTISEGFWQRFSIFVLEANDTHTNPLASVFFLPPPSSSRIMLELFSHYLFRGEMKLSHSKIGSWQTNFPTCNFPQQTFLDLWPFFCVGFFLSFFVFFPGLGRRGLLRCYATDEPVASTFYFSFSHLNICGRKSHLVTFENASPCQNCFVLPKALSVLLCRVTRCHRWDCGMRLLNLFF